MDTLSSICWAVCKWSMQASAVGYVVLIFTTIEVQGLHRYSEPVDSDYLLATYLTLLGLKEVVGELLGYFVLAFIVSGVAYLALLILHGENPDIE